MSALKWSFFATCVYLWRDLPVRLVTQRKSLRKFNLPPLAITCESVWPGHYSTFFPFWSHKICLERLRHNILYFTIQLSNFNINRAEQGVQIMTVLYGNYYRGKILWYSGFFEIKWTVHHLTRPQPPLRRKNCKTQGTMERRKSTEQSKCSRNWWSPPC